jgi:hypothetical protein
VLVRMLPPETHALYREKVVNPSDPSVAEDAVKSPTALSLKSTSRAKSAPGPKWMRAAKATHSLIRSRSFSRLQGVVGTLAGIASIIGAVFTLVEFVRPGNTGDLVTIVQAAGSRGSVTDATIEVLTTQDALVATLTPDATGRVTQELTEGVYVVRVSHPRYASEVRRVHVLPRQTVEMRASLRPGSSSPLKRAVNSSVGAVRKALRF